MARKKSRFALNERTAPLPMEVSSDDLLTIGSNEQSIEFDILPDKTEDAKQGGSKKPKVLEKRSNLRFKQKALEGV